MLIIVFFGFLNYIEAITININNDKNTTVSPLEIEIHIKDAFKKFGVKPTKEAAKKRIQENRILANVYIKKYGIPKNIYIRSKLNIESDLADAYVKKEQEKIELSNDVLKSYYIVHKEDFTKPKSIEAIVKRFNDYEKAVKFYNICRKENNITALTKEERPQEFFIQGLHPIIRPLLKKVKENSCIPPLYLGKDFLVFVIFNKKKEKILPFLEVKNQIRKILLKKAYFKTRKKLLREYYQ